MDRQTNETVQTNQTTKCSISKSMNKQTVKE